MTFPRIVLAAPKSGSGKTLISISMMKAFLLRGKKVAAFKCGPDYIDPMFHKKILKIPSKNLDLFFTDENTTQNLFCDENESDISIIEGVMGLYDGLGGISEKASTYDLAKTLRAPIILVVDAKGMSRSVLAEIAGFLQFDTENLIKGVILNRIPKSVFENLKPLVESRFKIKALGYFKEIKDFKIESRYLGLKLPDEINDIEENVKKAAEKLEKSVDLDKVWQIAESVTDFRGGPGNDINGESKSKVRIAVARDEAFCFYYEDNLRLLEKCGAEIVFFSPVHDSKLPENVGGIILGGGYPELFAAQLEQNESMREFVRIAVSNGVPSLAECGGFIYLHKSLKTRDGKSYRMAGVIDAETWWTGKLVRFGYVSIREKSPKFLNHSFEIKGHEFHYFDSTKNGADLTEEKPVSGKKFEAGFVDENRWWGFAHLYYLSNPEFARNFVEKCRSFTMR